MFDRPFTYIKPSIPKSVEDIMSRTSCDLILEIIPIFHQGLLAPLEEISETMLNNSFAEHKMTIGQIAIHCTAWMSYFLTDPKPWTVVDWTCKEVDYPLSLNVVVDIIEAGFDRMKAVLHSINDAELEIKDKKKGPGYIIMRLLHHILAHSNQMSYLRQLLDSEWQFGGHFGDMASALIALPYSTSRDIKIQGF